MSKYHNLSKKRVAEMLDVTFLDMTAPAEEFEKFLTIVKSIAPIAVCVHPCRVAETASFLKGMGIGIASVVSFPSGASTPQIKAAETACAISDGATELDMVVNLANIRDRNKKATVKDIESVVQAAKGYPVKVIVEAPLLSEDEKILVCEAIVQAGAPFIKTCSGFASNFADPEDVKMFRELLPKDVSIKASGKVGSFDRLNELYDAGARRFGVLASQANEILDHCSK